MDDRTSGTMEVNEACLQCEWNPPSLPGRRRGSDGNVTVEVEGAGRAASWASSGNRQRQRQSRTNTEEWDTRRDLGTWETLSCKVQDVKLTLIYVCSPVCVVKTLIKMLQSDTLVSGCVCESEVSSRLRCWYVTPLLEMWKESSHEAGHLSGQHLDPELPSPFDWSWVKDATVQPSSLCGCYRHCVVTWPYSTVTQWDHRCDTITALGSSFSNRLIHPQCLKERCRRSFTTSSAPSKTTCTTTMDCHFNILHCAIFTVLYSFFLCNINSYVQSIYYTYSDTLYISLHCIYQFNPIYIFSIYCFFFFPEIPFY